MEKKFLKSYVTPKCEVTAHVFSTTQNTDQLNTHQLDDDDDDEAYVMWKLRFQVKK